VLQLALDIQSKKDEWFEEIFFIEFDEFYENEIVDNINVLKLSNCKLDKMKFVIAIAEPSKKNKIMSELSQDVVFTSLISPLSIIARDVVYEKGLIVMPYSYISCNVSLGRHVHINSHSTIGHDTVIGDFFTTAHSVMIAGNNNISNLCYFGMNSSTRQGISICDNVIIGLNAGVVKNITKSGIYTGTPSKFLKS
jgi:sugar O-acyltransferase (sialic acid O-acetyltransferase NeuD family)